MVEPVVEQLKRDNYIDVIKGVGIFSVVIGHAFNTRNFYSDGAEMIRRFVYLYHLPIFFFCAGCFYRFRKPEVFFLKLIRRYYLPFVAIEFFSIVLYPLWASLGVFNPERWGGGTAHT